MSYTDRLYYGCSDSSEDSVSGISGDDNMEKIEKEQQEKREKIKKEREEKKVNEKNEIGEKEEKEKKKKESEEEDEEDEEEGKKEKKGKIEQKIKKAKEREIEKDNEADMDVDNEDEEGDTPKKKSLRHGDPAVVEEVREILYQDLDDSSGDTDIDFQELCEDDYIQYKNLRGNTTNYRCGYEQPFVNLQSISRVRKSWHELIYQKLKDERDWEIHLHRERLRIKIRGT